MGKIPMAEVGESEGAKFAVLQDTWMRRTGRTPIESNAAELQIQPFWPFGPLYTEGIDGSKKDFVLSCILQSLEKAAKDREYRDKLYKFFGI